jgi:hypothetical protein
MHVKRRTFAMTQTPATAGTSSADDQTVRNAAAFGWALTELISRCFMLQAYSDADEQARQQVWSGTGLHILRPIRTDRQQIYAVFFSVKSLAQEIKLDGQVDQEAISILGKYLSDDPNKPVDVTGKSYVDLIKENIDSLSHSNDPTIPMKFRGRINGLLEYWDTVIFEQLQGISNDPAKASACINAYLIGRSLSSLRWDFVDVDIHQLPRYGPPDKKPAEILKSVQLQILTEDSLSRLCQHVQLMGQSLPDFAGIALSNSTEQWGNALLQSKVSGSAVAKAKLKEQAIIWHDLLTGSRDPKSYVDPSNVGWRYTLKMFQFLLPYIGLGILLSAIIIVVFLFLLGFLWPLIVKAATNDKTLVSIVTTIGTGFALLTGIGAAIPPVGALWQWFTGKVQSSVDQSAGAAVSDAPAKLITMLWEAAQQEEINKATYIPVP